MARLQFESDLRAVLSTPEGRRIYWRAIDKVAAVLSLSFGFKNNATDTAFGEGKRDVGLTLIREAQEAVPALYLRMVSESIAAAAQAAEERKSTQHQPEQDNG